MGTVLFVSARNTNITSVQFVIKTDSIKTAAPEDAAVPEEKPLTFWQKLIRLFQ